MADAKRENERKERKTESGAYIVEGVAPEAGTKLTPERMAKSLNYLRFGYDPEEKIAEQAERIEQLEEAARHVRDELHFQAHAGYSYEKRVYFGQLSKALDTALSGEHLKKEEEV